MIIHIQLILLEFLSIVIHALIVVLRKDLLQKDEHVHVVNQQHQLPISLHLRIGQTILLVRVESQLLFDEVYELYDASFDLFEKLALLVHQQFEVVAETVEE